MTDIDAMFAESEANWLAEHPHWVAFYVTGTVGGKRIDYTHRTSFRKPIKLYDDEPGCEFRRLCARMIIRTKAANGLHPSTASKFFAVHVHDWSDSFDEAQEAFHQCR